MHLENLGEYDRMRVAEYALAQIVLLCFSLDDPASQINLTPQTQRAQFKGYTEELVEAMDASTQDHLHRLFFLVCTDVHNRSGKTASKEEGEKLAVRLGAVSYVEVSWKDLNSLKPLWEQLALAAQYSCLLSGELTFRVESGKGLAAKDINGKSDPYCIFGFADNDGKFLDSHKTKWIPKTLNPTWTDKEQPEHKFQVAHGRAAKFKVEVWDKDAVGKDDFMGGADIAFFEFFVTPTFKNKRLALRARAEKKKEKVSGAINVTWAYVPRKSE